MTNLLIQLPFSFNPNLPTSSIFWLHQPNHLPSIPSSYFTFTPNHHRSSTFAATQTSHCCLRQLVSPVHCFENRIEPAGPTGWTGTGQVSGPVMPKEPLCQKIGFEPAKPAKNR